MMAAGTAFTLIPSAQLLAKTPGKRYAMVFDVRRCTGCLSCTVSCAMENKTPVGRSRTDVSQVTVTGKSFGSAVLPMPHQCNHCDNPPCVAVCPAKATYKRPEDGIVVIDYNKCIHCQACTKACPYGARKADPEFKTARPRRLILAPEEPGEVPMKMAYSKLFQSTSHIPAATSGAKPSE